MPVKQKQKFYNHPELGEIFVEYSPRRLRAAISITAAENAPQITLKLPTRPHCEPEKYLPFINENIVWIKNKLVEFKKKITIHNYENGDNFYYLGKLYPLRYDNATFFDGRAFHVAAHSPLLAKRELEKIYLCAAREYIVPLCRKYAAQFGLSVGQIRINCAEKRWGSCNSEGDLNFSYRLMQRSEKFILYTVCHELAHRLHMNHSKAFYAVLKRFYPDLPPTE